VEYVENALRGDFGTSYRSNTPVVKDILLRFPTTFKLAVLGILFAVLVGVPIGAVSALRQYSILDNVSMVSAMLLASIPTFWLGLMLILLFAVKLGWFPATGAGSFIHYVLPAITVSTATMATLIRMTRSTMLEVIRQDYVRTARAKGTPERDIIMKHVLKNSLLPIITVIGINFGALLGGTIVVESVFAIPGLGTLILDAINMKDTPVIMAGVILLAILFSLINLIVDLLYAFVDPRVRSTFAAKRG
jgi:peptide/nickel transport system permease protein